MQGAIAEGWGEGVSLRGYLNGASIDQLPREHRPLTSILSPPGRGGQCKERVISLKREHFS
jgi:hypothetical protein